MLLGKLKIHGHSMEPAIKNNSLVLISNIFYICRHPKINDIVAFRLNGKIFVKRVIKIDHNEYLLEGDNKNDSFDGKVFGLVNRKCIIGKVFKII